MDTLAPLFSIIGCIGSLSAIILGVAAWKRSAHTDTATSSQQTGVILTTLGTIGADVRDIKEKQDKLSDRYADMHTEIGILKTTVETLSARTELAHTRIDAFKVRRQEV